MRSFVVCHRLYLLSHVVRDLNFFERREYDDHKSSLPKSSVITAIESHRFKYKVIDSCLDVEGFTPTHRAAHGAKMVAVRCLIERHGADVSLLSPQEHDALTPAIYHAEDIIWGNLERYKRHVQRKCF